MSSWFGLRSYIAWRRCQMLLLSGWMAGWVNEWTKERMIFKKSYNHKKTVIITLVTYLIDNRYKWMWPGFNSSFCSLPKIYKYKNLMGVNIRRIIFQVLERTGISLGMRVSQSSVLGRRGAILVPGHKDGSLLCSFANWLPGDLALCLHGSDLMV